MHEQSIARALIDQVLAEAQRRELDVIREVNVELGEFSGVESALLRSAFEELSPAWLGENVVLNVTETRLRARCTTCGFEFNVERFRFLCAVCGSNTTIIAGEDIVLIGLKAKTKAAAGETR